MVRPLTNADCRTGGASTRAAAAAHRPTVLLTGFDAFGDASINPSWLAAQALHRRQIAGHHVVAARLPTVFGQSLCELQALLGQHRPRLVVCLGLAAGRRSISLERVAINVNDARIADNAGALPIDRPVVAGGPVAYFTSLPIKAMLLALQRSGIAAEVSQTAGTFVCNQVFYGLMHVLATHGAPAGVRGGFVHLPLLPEQGTPCMPLADMVRGLRIAIRCALQTERDVPVGAGSID